MQASKSSWRIAHVLSTLNSLPRKLPVSSTCPQEVSEEQPPLVTTTWDSNPLRVLITSTCSTHQTSMAMVMLNRYFLLDWLRVAQNRERPNEVPIQQLPVQEWLPGMENESIRLPLPDLLTPPQIKRRLDKDLSRLHHILLLDVEPSYYLEDSFRVLRNGSASKNQR